MKKYAFLLFLLFSALIYLSGTTKQENSGNTDSLLSGFFLADTASSATVSIHHVLDVDFDKEGTITVRQKMRWENLTSFSADSIVLRCKPEMLRNNIYGIPFFGNVSLNGNLVDFQHSVSNDSSSVTINFSEPVLQNDKLDITTGYSVSLKKDNTWWGIAEGNDYLYFSDWYFNPAVYGEGKWLHYPDCNKSSFNDFAGFDVTISYPGEYSVTGSGINVKREEKKNSVVTTFRLQKGLDFAWFAMKDINRYTKKYISAGSGKVIDIDLYLFSEGEEQRGRYFDAIVKNLEFAESSFGEYPFPFLTLVELPRNYEGMGESYPGLFAAGWRLINADSDWRMEMNAASAVYSQYFSEALSVNEYAEKWLSEGVTRYLAERESYRLYGKPAQYFDLVSYFPIPGMNFLSYNEIPIIYTLGQIKKQRGAEDIRRYLSSPFIGTVSDTTCSFPTRESYLSNTYYKVSLMLRVLESYISSDTLTNSLAEYYLNNKWEFVSSPKFWGQFDNKNNFPDNFIKNFYRGNNTFDYMVESVKEVRENVYEVFVRRAGSGIIPTEVALFTEQDTLIQMWDGKDSWKKLYFKTENEVTAATIDPYRKNLLDINIANNSYTLEKKYWASWSLSIRWFFWIQNALMIMGSIG